MPLNLFYTMVQKSQKWPKTQIKGGSCLVVLLSANWAFVMLYVPPRPKTLRQAHTSNYRRVHAREITRLYPLACGCPIFFGQGSSCLYSPDLNYIFKLLTSIK